MSDSLSAARGSGGGSGGISPPQPHDPPAQSGDVLLFRRYRVIRELGRGGMGVVLLAQDTALDIPVAVKLVTEVVVRDTDSIADLRKEVLRGMALAHPGIVRTHNFERDESGAGIVMEFVDGDTLTDLKARQPGGCFDPEQILPWLEQLCPVLDYAHHEAHIVHRDLKPRNIMLTKSGKVKVADFGIAAVLSDSVSRHSMEGRISGTLTYMSPQQAEGKRPTHLDDIHALGATIYELLTGKPPFCRGNPASIHAQIISVVPPSIAERREDFQVAGRSPIPAEWEDTIALCLAKNPAQRPQSAGEVLARLTALETRPAAVSKLATNTPSQPLPQEPERPDQQAIPSVEAKPAAPKTLGRRTRKAVWISTVCLGLLAICLGWFAHQREKTPARLPRDGQAVDALTFARNLCFVEDDWQRGTSLLAEREGPFQEVAAAEIQFPARFSEVELGRLWLSAAADAGAVDQWHCYRRARSWFRKALETPGLKQDREAWVGVREEMSRVPALKTQLQMKGTSFHDEKLTIQRTSMIWWTRSGGGQSQIIGKEQHLPEFKFEYGKSSRRTFSAAETRGVLPAAVDFTTAKIASARLGGKLGRWTRRELTPAVDGNSITVEVRETGNYQGSFTFDLVISFGEEGVGLPELLPTTP